MTVLADVLDVAGRPERISAPGEELFVTVKLNCGGAVQRVVKSGKVPVPFTGYRVRAGQFIYSRIDARNGAFAIVPEELHGAVVSKDFPVFDVRREQIDERYLVHFLRAGRLQEKIRAASFGATNRQRITEEHLLGFEIFLPPLDEQRRIAAILDQADAIRTKRRQMLAHLDDLTRAIFHEMFDGESYSEIAIGEFASVSSGSTPSRANASNFEGTVPWVKTAEVLGSEITATREHISDRAVAESRLKIFPPGAIVMAMYGQGATRGRCGILGIEATVNQACAVIQPNDRDLVRSGFLFEQLKGKYESIRRLGEGGNQPNLNKARVAGIKVIVPPAEVQDEFVSRLNGINALRQKAQRTLAADDEVFASLQSRVFCGER